MSDVTKDILTLPMRRGDNLKIAVKRLGKEIVALDSCVAYKEGGESTPGMLAVYAGVRDEWAVRKALTSYYSHRLTHLQFEAVIKAIREAVGGFV